jgi:hypothetical protein
MPTWSVKTEALTRYPEAYGTLNGEFIRSFLRKGERITAHHVMVRDRSDGTCTIMDAVIIAGNDKVKKARTARAVIRIGRRDKVTHGGDFRVNIADVLTYTPVCALEVCARMTGTFAAGQRPSKTAAIKTVENHVWRIFNSARKSNFWLAGLAKRNLKAAQENLMPQLRYYGITDEWRVPRNKVEAYRAFIQFTRANRWASETVAPVKGII